MTPMKTSENGFKFVMNEEGFSPKAYPDKGFWSVGYGTSSQVKPQVKQGFTIDQATAEQWLREECAVIENTINLSVKVQLTQNQFDALVSFCYNEGKGAFVQSTMLKDINAGHFGLAASEFAQWIYAKNMKTGKKEVCDTLKARRAREQALFMSKK